MAVHPGHTNAETHFSMPAQMVPGTGIYKPWQSFANKAGMFFSAVAASALQRTKPDFPKEIFGKRPSQAALAGNKLHSHPVQGCIKSTP